MLRLWQPLPALKLQSLIMTKMYGVKLLTYDQRVFNTWVFDTEGRFETPEYDEALALKREYQTRNPKGDYEVIEIGEEDV